jgi:hypothetical protein
VKRCGVPCAPPEAGLCPQHILPRDGERLRPGSAVDRLGAGRPVQLQLICCVCRQPWLVLQALPWLLQAAPWPAASTSVTAPRAHTHYRMTSNRERPANGATLL